MALCTGYTYPVAEGKIDKLGDFILSCAKAFGACVSMREEPADTPIPEEFVLSDYHEKSVNEARQALEKLVAIPPSQYESNAEESYQEKLKSYNDYMSTFKLENERIKAMLKKVDNWVPPTPKHKELKSFMVSQLEKSYQADTYLEAPTRLSGVAWFQNELERATRSYNYALESFEKAKAQNKESNDWIRELRESIDKIK